MGNRAVITAHDVTNVKNSGYIGIYLHWNGGRDSVEAFLTYCKIRMFTDPARDEQYAMARLCQIIGNYFGGGFSVGIDRCCNLDCDNYDNGVYVIGANWEIVGRQYFSGEEQKCHDLKEMLYEIDQRQPERERVGSARIDNYLEQGGLV